MTIDIFFLNINKQYSVGTITKTTVTMYLHSTYLIFLFLQINWSIFYNVYFNVLFSRNFNM